MANLEGGENCDVSWTLPDHPTIDVATSDDGESGGGGDVSGTYVTDLNRNYYSNNLSVDFSDGTNKIVSLPTAISAISREKSWV